MRTRRLVAAVAVLVVVTAACSSDDGSFELGDDDGSAAAVEKPRVEVTEDPDLPPPDDDEPLYPPLPPLEPDPDSEIPVDMQEAALALHERFYEVTQRALATGEYDRDQLAEVLSAELLEGFVGDLASREPGHVSRSPDTDITWVEVVEAGSGPIVIQECRVVGPETGLYDSEGVRISPERDEPEARVFQTTYALIEVDEELFDYRVIEAGSAVEASLCRA